MIPQRIYVKGFMSYREEAELTFDGAPLWILKGKNGAGKSAIFDAVTFALYGRHRGGKQNYTDLVNHESDSLIVEFEFLIDKDVYRVRRTVSSNGRSTRQIFHLSGPNAPYPGRPGPQPVPQTDMDDGFRSWIEGNIGLSDETFTASILLQQGKSDKLLEVTPAERHIILSELIDLSAFRELEESARNKHSELASEAKALSNQLSEVPSVTLEELDAIEQELNNIEINLAATEKLLENNIRLQSDAKQWASLKADYISLSEQIAHDEILFAQSSKVEADAARLAELTAVLPILKELQSMRRRYQELQRNIAQNDQQADELTRQAEVISTDLESVRFVLFELRRKLEASQKRQLALAEARQPLERSRHDLEEMERLRTLVLSQEEKLRSFSSDLDNQVADAYQEVTTRQLINLAIPWLQQLIQARDEWNESRGQEEESQDLVSACSTQLSDARNRIKMFEIEQEKTDRATKALSKELGAAEQARSNSMKQLRRLKEVEGKPTCQYCGQDLTPEHMEAEEARVDKEIRDTSAEVVRVQDAYDEAKDELKSIDQQLSELETLARELIGQIEVESKEVENARNRRKRAEKQAEESFARLSKEYQLKVRPSKDVSLISAPYPTPNEMDDLQNRVSHLEQFEATLKDLHTMQSEQVGLKQQLKPTIARLQELESDYPAERIESLRQEIAAQEEEKNSLEASIKGLGVEIEENEKRKTKLEQSYEATKDRRDRAVQTVEKDRGRTTEIEAHMSRQEASLSLPWASMVGSFTDDELQRWIDEKSSLTGADSRLQELEIARREHATRLQRRTELDGQLVEIPKDAQRPTEELESAAVELRNEKRACTEARDIKLAQKHEREERRSRRLDLEKRQAKAMEMAQLYRTLTIFLGRDRLQRFLLRQVEKAIVDNANEVLERVSGGSLSLELREGDSKNALDIVVYNAEVGHGVSPKPMPVAYLSGSQRFRVAVSLALGIGRYANQGLRRVESVIIDEGFGGLDLDGRGQMIDELKDLKQELHRIILVSHQEEFANAFTNGYEIRLENGCSIATLLEN